MCVSLCVRVCVGTLPVSLSLALSLTFSLSICTGCLSVFSSSLYVAAAALLTCSLWAYVSTYAHLCSDLSSGIQRRLLRCNQRRWRGHAPLPKHVNCIKSLRPTHTHIYAQKHAQNNLNAATSTTHCHLAAFVC